MHTCSLGKGSMLKIGEESLFEGVHTFSLIGDVFESLSSEPQTAAWWTGAGRGSAGVSE